ncbi:hypothetical protein [Streptomyces sp. NPDC004065]|uniref:hypothetical protein n=1 Tax=Streptomyces sp. NPDC004065 TaxID=3364689 RepID=UPI00384B30D0
MRSSDDPARAGAAGGPGRATSGEHRCPVCGQPLEMVVRRHKTLGAWVPVWAPGPCRNPDCGAPAPRPADQRDDEPSEPGS